ncbi:multidrug/biocide efflux PACE transporter [Ralstonia sp. CHL-2022]|uniref:Multidrug/biocide efflux PACE transporter n=1 Tax=Ralstonia mojiangensis TaxID=2953895 RepID=A0AAE3LCE2_9RALS|nr:multidrug/biocide efflux PACE transporter [Ralstonia mojiangensis]MCT7318019.1 multidrug/biocide efflux PACE transporter [Ralstonia mojiangensis]
MQVIQKTPAERLVHALTFELVAMLICAPLFSWLMDLPLAEMGVMTLMFAAVAMVWNMVFNAIFERVERRYKLSRTVALRVVHACLFEGGLVLMLVPLAAWWLDVGLWEAFVLDIGIMLLFLPYTFFFNLAYDHVRARWMSRRALA